MGLLELFGEYKSADVGTIGQAGRGKTVELTPAVPAKGLLAIGVLAITEWGMASTGYPILCNILLLIYLVVSYNVDADPRMDKPGLLGGLIDHPFKYTDQLSLSGLTPWRLCALTPWHPCALASQRVMRRRYPRQPRGRRPARDRQGGA